MLANTAPQRFSRQKEWDPPGQIPRCRALDKSLCPHFLLFVPPMNQRKRILLLRKSRICEIRRGKGEDESRFLTSHTSRSPSYDFKTRAELSLLSQLPSNMARPPISAPAWFRLASSTCRTSSSSLSPFINARFAPLLSRNTRTPLSPLAPFVTRPEQLRLLTTSRPFLAPSPSSPSNSSTPTTATESKEVAVDEKEKKAVAKKGKEEASRMARIWASIKKEASHYWHGTKLLGKEIRISARLVRRLIVGKKLTRREHRQVRPLSFSPDSVYFELTLRSPCSSNVLPPICSDSSLSQSSSSSRSWNSFSRSHSSSSPTCFPRLSLTSSRR